MGDVPTAGRGDGWPAAIPEDVRVLRRLAVGGMAEVFEVERGHGPTVACKVLLPGADANVRKLFAREAAALRGIRSPHVVGFVDSGPDYLLVDFIDGCDLAALNAHFRRRGMRLPPAASLHLAHDILSGVEALHAAGIVHRDLNPRNVMVGLDGRARIIDLGIAKRPGLQQSTVDGLKGTLAFMAPEQLAGHPVNSAADVYALGLILYGMVTGTSLAASHATLSELMAVRSVTPRPPSAFGASPIGDDVLLKALAPAPAERWPDAGAFRQQLAPRPPDSDRATIRDAVSEVGVTQTKGSEGSTSLPGGTVVPASTSASPPVAGGAMGTQPPSRPLGRAAVSALALGVLVAVAVVGWSVGKNSAESEGVATRRSGQFDRRARRLARGEVPRGPVQVRVEAVAGDGGASNVERVSVDGTAHDLPATLLIEPGVTRVVLGQEHVAVTEADKRKGLRLRLQGRRLVLVARDGVTCGAQRRQPLPMGQGVTCEGEEGTVRLTRLRSDMSRKRRPGLRAPP